MKLKLIILILLAFSIETYSQSQPKQISENNVYKLFPTKNYWTFIKLDSRNGQMWQIHFDVKDDARAQVVLNAYSLIDKEKETSGRFTLQSTENIYNFLLIDQIDGNVFQVQWSMEPKNRFVIPILNK